MENDTLQQPVFTICIPTYNRGLTALINVLTILPSMDDNWELLVLDNASDHEAESYQQIEALAQVDSRLRYIRHASNRGFQGNFMAAFDLARSPHMMLTSDEDYANTDMIRKVLPMLQASPELAIVRGSIARVNGQRPRNMNKYPNLHFNKGEDALLGFCLGNTYMSGVIFNRDILIRNGLIELLREGIHVNAIYPHLYLELLASSQFEVAFTEEAACVEGDEKQTEGNVPMTYAPPYSFGSRVDQFITLRNSIRQAIALMPGDFDNVLFIRMYIGLCNNYMRLISLVNSPMYVKNHLDLGLLQDSFFQIMGAAVFAYPDMMPYQDDIFREVNKIYEKYKLKPEEPAAVENEMIAA